MVKNSRTASRPDHLRTLNAPRPIQIVVDQGDPVAMFHRGHRIAVEHIQDTWIVQDEWWREEIDRQYYALLFRDGVRRTVYHDRIAGTWFEQTY